MCINIIPTTPWSPWWNEEQQPLHRLQYVTRSTGCRSPRSARVCPGQSRIKDPLHNDLKTCCIETSTVRHIIYKHTDRTVRNSHRPAKHRLIVSAVRALEFLFPSPEPPKKCSGPLQKDPHPELGSGRALTPSRTRFSSPLATAREQDGLVPTTFPEGTKPGFSKTDRKHSFTRTLIFFLMGHTIADC
jgi:hypothetical protein